MTKEKVSPASIERVENLAADALEGLIEDFEKKEHVKVEDVDVALIPDAHGASPSVYVTVNVKEDKAPRK